MYEQQISTIKKHLLVKDDKVLATSLDVSNFFGKKHKDVLKAIRNLEIPADFAGRHFAPGEYADAQNQMRPMYEMTRDGFSLLAMGLTGAEAMKFKVAYITAFNQMEKVIVQAKGNSRLINETPALPEDSTLLTKDRYIDLLETENKFLKGEKLRKNRKPVPLTDEDRQEIIDLFANGMSQADIARHVKRSGATISYVVRMSVKRQ